MRVFTTIVFAAAAVSQMGSTDCGQVITDSGFDLWCGSDTLCAWKVERGSIADVPTWHAGDHGVALIGSDVAIEQVSPVASSDGTCFELDLIANVGADANAVLNVDVFDDGTIDLAEHLPTGTWQPLTFQIRMPDNYSGVRFEIAKTGSGATELANIGAQVAMDGCQDEPPMQVTMRPLAAPCDDAAECASGICGAPPVPYGPAPECLGCDAADPCTGSQICGAADPVSPLRGPEIECVDAPAVLGEQCAGDTDCAAGHCVEGMCSTCGSDADCAGGQPCKAAWSTNSIFGGTYSLAPSECAPGQGLQTSGAPCVTDADCASGECDGASLSTCDDGRSCATAADCPYSGLDQTACTLVGVSGGSCH